MADFNINGTLEIVQGTGFFRGDVNQWPEFQELSFSSNQVMPRVGWWPDFSYGCDVGGSQPNPFFVKSNGYYHDVSQHITGMDNVNLGPGIATADIEGDGDLDLIISNQWGASYLYVNQCQDCSSNFLGLRLVNPVVPIKGRFQHREGLADKTFPSKAAIGATALLRKPDGTEVIAQVDGGSGHTGQRSSQIHFGLGKHDGTTLEVEIRWLDQGGLLQIQEFKLSPGWHTIYLGNSEGHS